MVRLTALCVEAEHTPDTVDPEEFSKLKQALDVSSVRVHEVAIAHSIRGGSIL